MPTPNEVLGAARTNLERDRATLEQSLSELLAEVQIVQNALVANDGELTALNDAMAAVSTAAASPVVVDANS